MGSTKLHQYQLNIFFDDNFYYGNKADICEQIDISNSDVFNECNKTPIPSDAPRELPRINLSGELDDVNVRAQISYRKATFEFTEKQDEGDNMNSIAETEIKKVSCDEVLDMLEEFDYAQRIGLIMRFSIMMDIEPVEYISAHVLKEGTDYLIDSKGLRNFQVNLTYDKNILGGEGNHLLKLSKEMFSEHDVIGVQSDVNTHQERSGEWRTGDIKEFIDESYQRQNVEEIFEALNNN